MKRQAQTLEIRRQQHNERVEAWRKLSPEQQLFELAQRPGKSERQVARIRARRDAGRQVVTQ